MGLKTGSICFNNPIDDYQEDINKLIQKRKKIGMTDDLSKNRSFVLFEKNKYVDINHNFM